MPTTPIAHGVLLTKCEHLKTTPGREQRCPPIYHSVSTYLPAEGPLPPFFQFLMPAAQSYLMINANGKEVPKSKDRLTIHATPLPRSSVG